LSYSKEMQRHATHLLKQSSIWNNRIVMCHSY